MESNIAIAQYTIQGIIFSANIWTPTLQAASGNTDSKNNRTKRLNPTFNIWVHYSKCKIQNNIAIARYTVQRIIFSANLWTPTLQAASGNTDSEKMELNSPTQYVRRQGSLILPYNTPKQTGSELYQTILSRILQHGFHVRSYDNMRTPINSINKGFTPTSLVNKYNLLTKKKKPI